MAKPKKRVQSKRKKNKLLPVPHNNRARTSGRMCRLQVIIYKDKDNEDKLTKKTVLHMNLSAYEQHRMHVIKEAVANNDTEARAKLNKRERELFDTLVLLKEAKEKKDGEAKDNN
jgi:hypothetical protein